MAEKVIVKGGGALDGAQFDNAATEATLRELIKTVKDTKCCGDGGDKKLEALAARALRENISGVNDSTSAYQSSTKEVGLLGKAAQTTGSLLSSGLSALAGGMISGVVTAGETLFKFFTDSLDSFRETSSVGASFNNDLVMLRKTAAGAGMSLEDFTGMVSKNSKLMASLGGTTTKGAMAFAEMSGQIRNSEFGKNMQMTGMTTGDLNDYLSGYLEIQQRAGKIEGKIGEKERQGAEAYIEEMDRMTKMTGVSRQAGQDALRTAMKDGKSLNLASKLSGQALLNFQAGLTLMNTTLDPSAMKSLTNMMSGVIDPGDRFAKMLTQASPGIMNFQRALGKGQLSAEQQVKGYKEQERSIGDYLSRFSDEQIARDANLTQLKEYQASLKRYKEMNYDDAVKEQTANNALTKALGTMGQTFQTIKGKILGAMLESNVFEKFEAVLKKIAEKFDAYAKPIGDFLANFIDDIDKAFSGPSLMDGISAAFGNLFAKLTPIVRDLFKSLFSGSKKESSGSSGGSGGGDDGLFSELTKGMKESFPFIGTIETAINGLSWAFENMSLVLLGGGAVAGGVIFALSKLGGIGKTLGGIGEGILSGIAKGLAAFANPATAIGAGILALAIVGIGAAVAGATWMIGKALPTFAEGMKSFEQLDGDRLVSVGLGIGAIGVAMAAFGVGGIAAGVGNVIGNLLDALPGKSMIQKLQEFQNVELNAIRIENNANAIVAYGKAMAAFGAGGAIGSLGNAASNAIDGITAFFGGSTTPWDKLKDFGEVKLDEAKIRKNAEILNLFSSSISTFNNAAGSSITNVGGDFASQAAGINTFATAIKNLDTAIKALNVSLKDMTTPTAGGRGQAPGKSGLETMSAIGANTGGGAASEKLNTLVAELVSLTKEIKDSSKDQADALKGRRDAL